LEGLSALLNLEELYISHNAIEEIQELDTNVRFHFRFELNIEIEIFG